MPNAVVVHTDDTGQYIEPYGHDVSTPNLQEMAEEGVLFRNAFCAAPTCSPSPGAMFSGQAPHSNGLTGLAHRGFAMGDYSQHLVRHRSSVGLLGPSGSVSVDTRRESRPPRIACRTARRGRAVQSWSARHFRITTPVPTSDAVSMTMVMALT